MPYDYLLNYIIIGDAGVGKSCLLLNFIGKGFRTEHSGTVGVEFGHRITDVGQKTIKFHIWDTAGQEKFKSLTRNYYRNAAGALVVYDVTRRDSFQNIVRWMEEVREHCNSEVSVVLIGNKCDLDEERQVSYEEGEALAKENNMLFLETSAKLAKNVEQAFLETGEMIMNKLERGQIQPKESLGIKTGPKSEKIKLGGETVNPAPNRANDCQC